MREEQSARRASASSTAAEGAGVAVAELAKAARFVDVWRALADLARGLAALRQSAAGLQGDKKLCEALRSSAKLCEALRSSTKLCEALRSSEKL